MRTLVTGTIGALLLVAAMVAPTLAHTATVTCDHITFGNVPAGVSAVMTPGPITIAPANATTSIDGTYEVPPATYLIKFSDGSVIHSKTVPACPSPSPSAPPSSGPSDSPSAAPSTIDTPAPSTIETPAPSTIDTPAPSTIDTPAPSPSASSGGVLGATATPRTTAPATDALADPPSNGFGTSLPLLVFLLAGINVGLVLILRTPSHARGRSNRG